MSATRPNLEMHMRVQGGNLVTLLIPGSARVLMPGGRASLSDVRPGDSVIVSGQPDPTAALIYGVNWLRDRDLAPFAPQTGVIVNLGQEGSADFNAGKEGQVFTVAFGRKTMAVDVDPSTRILLRNGHAGSLRDLRPGVQMRVTGIQNTRLQEVTSSQTIQVLRRGRVPGQALPKTLAGTIEKLSLVKSRVEVRLRLRTGSLVTIVLDVKTPVTIRGGHASVAELQAGDRVAGLQVQRSGQALVFTGRAITDSDLATFTNQRGVFFSAGPEPSGGILEVRGGRLYTVLFGHTTQLVEIDRATHILLRNGRRGSAADLQPGVHAAVTGIRNTRTNEVTSTAVVRIA